MKLIKTTQNLSFCDDIFQQSTIQYNYCCLDDKYYIAILLN
jgi:hypothetical protein